MQDGTIADGVTSFAAETINKAGFKLGSLGVVAGTKAGNETATTEVHYPADASGMAQQVADAFGIGQLVEDDAIKSGHVLLVVGTDLDTSGTPTTAGRAAVGRRGSAGHHGGGDRRVRAVRQLTGCRRAVDARGAARADHAV